MELQDEHSWMDYKIWKGDKEQANKKSILEEELKKRGFKIIEY